MKRKPLRCWCGKVRKPWALLCKQHTKQVAWARLKGCGPLKLQV